MAGKKDGKNDDQFPVMFDNGKIRVFRNPSDEIFVADLATGVTIRMNSYHHGGLKFTTDDRVEPIRVTNMIGWSIVPRG